MEIPSYFTYIFYVTRFGCGLEENERLSRPFIYHLEKDEKHWNNDKIIKTIDDLRKNSYKVNKIEFVEKRGIATKITRIPIPL